MSDQLLVGQLQNKVEELKTEFDLIRSVKDSSVNAKIQRSRDKICDILRRVQSKRVKVPTEVSESTSLFEHQEQPEVSFVKQLDEEVLQRRHYIFQFKMYLRRKRERRQREEEFKLLKQLDTQTQAIQRWVTKGNNDDQMYEFFFSQIDPKRKGVAHQLQIKNFFFENPLILSLFKFDRNSLQHALDSYKVAERFHMSELEFINFLKTYQKYQPQPGFRQYIHLFDPLYQKNPRVLLLKDLSPMRQAFQSVENQGLANLDQLIRAIRNAEGVTLFTNAVHIVLLGLNLVLESALQIIELENLEQIDTMVSWNDFLYFFDNIPDEENEEPQEAAPVEDLEEYEDVESEDEYFYKMVSKGNNVPQPLQEAKQPRVRNQRRKKDWEEVNVEKKKITVPLKQGYEKREASSSPSIRQRWLQQIIAKKQEEEEEAFKYRPFKANTIPYKVRDRKYYQELLDREEIRRRELKEKSKDLTLKKQTPFSFYERDMKKKEQKAAASIEDEEEKFKFRANPIPWYCSLKLYERKLTEQKRQSDNRKKIRQFWLTENSRLPPRMQEHMEREKDKERERAQSESRLQTKRSIRQKSKPIPDFRKLHSEFEKELLAKKKEHKQTVPVSPSFHQSRKKPDRRYMDNESRVKPKEDPVQKAKRALKKKPKQEPKSTQKFEAMIEWNKLMKWSEMQNLAQMASEQMQREEKKQLFLPRVQQSWAITDHAQLLLERQQMKQIEAFQRRREEDENFNNMMKEIFVRVYQRPLLMELETMKSQPLPMEQQEENQFDYMNPIGEQEEEESERQNSAQDPEGVEQVGDQAEQSLPLDGQDIDDGSYDQGHRGEHEKYSDDYEGEEEEEIDLENIDPKLLEQMQRQALAEQYRMPDKNQQLRLQDMDDEEGDDEGEDDEEDYYQKRHSF